MNDISNKKTMPQHNSRHPQHPINDLFIHRWSPRAFDGTSMAQKEVQTLLEAGRWAPSAYNIQPWQFAYSLKGDAYWDGFVSAMDEFNTAWGKNGSAIIIALADTVISGRNGTPDRPSGTYQLDMGLALQNICLQATISGFQAHIIKGFDAEAAHAIVKAPHRMKVEAMVIVGRQAAPEALPDDLKQREKHSDRKPFSEVVLHGEYSHG